MMPLAHVHLPLFMVRTPEFAYRLNFGLAIQAKNAILFGEDSPAT
jgi:hypothetical protein